MRMTMRDAVRRMRLNRQRRSATWRAIWTLLALVVIGFGLFFSRHARTTAGDTIPSTLASTVLIGVPSDVTAEMSEPDDRRVKQATAFTDCCIPCEEQYLEALVPTQGAPSRVENGGLPYRRQFCGTANRYGVNDEQRDPRDIMINILPSPVTPYPDFVNGFINTEATPLEGDNLARFGPENRRYWVRDYGKCLYEADHMKKKDQKVVHAEITPDERFYGEDRRFLPIRASGECSNDWGCLSELESNVDLCVYGVFAIDHGSHSASKHTLTCCSLDPGHDRPEIHPFDAIWWKHPDKNGWMFAVFQDDSNRYSFPHCDDDHNGNEWSQAPRDVTFRFPFKFQVNEQHWAILRHAHTPDWYGKVHDVWPKNVTTGAYVPTNAEPINLVINGQTVLKVFKDGGTAEETLIQLEGKIVRDMVVGQLILRVAVGCDDRRSPCVKPMGPTDHRTPIFNRLGPVNSHVIYDKNDPGTGYYYAELVFY